ncbi:MAG: F0F1 ATP synthase subunit B [Anaerolineae bacterium]|nr:F0F1 ATP synthase subunit B [Anaerolineae bacterium]
MRNKNMIVRLLMLVLVLTALVIVPVAAAQEGGEAGGETAATAEGGEAQAVEAPATSPLTPLGINTGFLIAQIINFLIIFLLLTGLMWRPLTRMLDSRAKKIEKGLEDAAAAANARRNAEAEAEKILASARADAAREIEAARSRGEEVSKQVISEANQEAERIRTEARARGEEERNKQLADLRSQVANISLAVANNVIRENLDAKKQSALIDNFFANVPEGAKALKGAKVDVVSAMPLSEAEQNKIKKEVGASEATFLVDPNILGGLVIRSADRVVDGSVRSNMSELAGRLR